jgi:Ion channel
LINPSATRASLANVLVSVGLMVRRMLGAMRHAAKEENFAAVCGAGIVLIAIGTLTYSLAEGWRVADGFYFAVSTLTTSSIADPDLTLTSEAIKIFTAFYVLTGIGILVELARELGVGFIKMREEHHATRHARRHHEEDPTGGAVAGIGQSCAIRAGAGGGLRSPPTITYSRSPAASRAFVRLE